MKRRVTCPERGTLAEIELSEDPVDGRILGVVSCSLLGYGDVCEELCARRLQARREARLARGTAPPCDADDRDEEVTAVRPRAAPPGTR